MPLDATMRGLSSVIRRHDSAKELRTDARAFLSEAGVQGADLDQMAGLGAERLLVYRRLVFNRFVDVIEMTLPRIRERRGREAFHADVSMFLQERASSSPYLRDIASEFVEWVGSHWQRDESVPAYFHSLARHELLSFEIAAMPEESREVEEAELDLDRPVIMQSVARVVRYGHAVHELPSDVEDQTEPEQRETALLAYRDREHKVRYLDLGAASAEIVEALLHRGATLRDAIASGAEAGGVDLDDAYLGGVANMLADLAQRGVLLGPDLRSG